jgi:hypothetical protein
MDDAVPDVLLAEPRGVAAPKSYVQIISIGHG